MELLLFRHAMAVPRAEPALDHARPLSPKGRRRFEEAVEGLDALGVRVDRVLHSPWVRAVQTAELLEPIARGGRVPTELLAQAPSTALLGELGRGRAALVGHEPWMGELLALLLLGDAASGHLFPFRKGGVAHLDGEPEPGGCVLRAFYPPRALRLAARR